jgi:hypothetical protein
MVRGRVATSLLHRTGSPDELVPTRVGNFTDEKIMTMTIADYLNSEDELAAYNKTFDELVEDLMTDKLFPFNAENLSDFLGEQTLEWFDRLAKFLMYRNDEAVGVMIRQALLGHYQAKAEVEATKVLKSGG